MSQLKLEIKSYWHPGSGRGRGSHIDATTHRNAYNLPNLPGRTLKGLVRNAVHRWEQFGGYAKQTMMTNVPTIADCLFGPYGDKTWAGLLRFSDAELPPDEIAALVDNPVIIAGLYREYFSTAIDHATGTALENSLRSIELVVPLTLYAQIDLIPTAKYLQLQNHWQDLLKPALSLIQAIGAYKSRGLGRAIVTIEGVE